MKDLLKPVALDATPLSMIGNEDESAYDLVIASVGYEARAVHVAQSLSSRARRIVAFTFDSNRVLAYERNRAYFQSVGTVIDRPQEEFEDALRGIVAEVRERVQTGPGTRVRLRMAVDISSMSRQRIADALLALHKGMSLDLQVDWLYAPARVGDSAHDAGVITVNEPIRGFEGWGDPERPLVCVLGAGFEGELALGILDDLEPRDTWVFSPLGYSEAHDKRLLAVNDAVFRSIKPGRIVQYRVDQPYESLLRLESLVDQLVSQYRVVLLPLGPKAFALNCLLVGLADRRNVAVWRVSSDSHGNPNERSASGDIFGLRVATSMVVRAMGS